MTQDFVRSRPDVERADPDVEQNLQSVLEGVKRAMARPAAFFLTGLVATRGAAVAIAQSARDVPPI